MKRVLRFSLFVLMSLVLVVSLGQLPAFRNSDLTHQSLVYAAETKVTTVALNLRSGPGTGYSILLTMPKGSTVTVLSSSGDWSKVTYQGTTGYAYSAYLATDAGTRYYTTTGLNLRTGPGTGYSIILTMPKGSSVTVYSIAGNWAKLTYSGRSGYAYAPYLSQTAPSTEPEPATIKKIFKGVTSYSGKRIAITFDDGASATNVGKVLDILDRYDAKSTFFFTGEWILNHPVTARKIIARGHRMESHTISHPFLTTLSDAQVRYQLTRSREIIRDTVGTTATMIRPPYGDTSARVQRIAGEVGYKYMVMWSIDTDDYKSTSTASSITRKAVEGATNNGILLLHPSHYRVIEALPQILSQLRDKGYLFTTVNAMVP